MADKTPVRVVFNASNVATGLAEFQSGDTVGTAFGGTGLTSIGSAGQVLKVNAAGNALEFAAEGDVSITNLVAPTNADLTFTTSGTGNIVLDAITVRGTTLSSADSSSININEGLIVDGTLNVSGQATLSGLAFPTSDGSANQFLKTDGSGTLSFADVSLGDFSFIGSTISNSSNADLTLDPSGTGSIKLNAATDVTGAVTITTTTTDASLLITTTEDSNSAAPVIELKRNSSSPADADYLGRLTFKGENDADQAVTYARISGKILDASDGSEDGAIEFNTIKAGSGTISARLNSDELKLLNGTTLDVDGSGTFAGSVTATSLTTNTISSNGSNADLSIQPSGTGDVLISALRVNGTTLDSSDSSIININENTIVDGTLTVSGALASSTSLALASGATVTGIADEDDMSSDSNTLLATQQSIKAFVESGTSTLSNKTLTSPTINSPTIATPTVTGAMTATSVTSNDFTSNGSNADITIAPQGTGDINLTAGADVNIPANIGITFGNDAEKIEGDGTDLTITGNNIKLTATADVIIPTNVGLHFTDANEKIESDGSKLVITSGGTAFNLPTSDGSAGQALVTDGAGTLSFDSVSTTISDDTLATVRNNKHMGTQARSIDSINASFIDSAFYFLVYNDVLNEVVSAECLSVTNNDSASFLGNRRGINTTAGSNVPTLTTDVTNGQFRLRAAGSSADCLASFYKIAMSSSTADATRGNTVTTSNTDVDSASESIDTFAHGTYRGAKYFISVDNDSKTEMDVVEAIVVHDGSDAYIKSYGHNSSNGDSLITLTAAISGDNVVVSAAGLETNLNLTIHKILLKDNMTASSNANQKAFASVTVSSSATAIDLMDLDDANGAVYFIVGANSSEGAYSIQEVYTAATPGVPAVANGPYVSTKGTTQLEFTAGFDTSTENSLELFASSTSGGSTTVSGYRISALAG